MNQPLPKLGRGLSSLMQEASAAHTISSPARTGFFRIPVESVVPPAFVRRREPDSEEELQSLAMSVRDRGVLQPILVRKVEAGYELIAGQRRLDAAAANGLKDIPAYVVEASDQQCRELFLVENLLRKPLDDASRQHWAEQLAQEFNLSVDQQYELLHADVQSAPMFVAAPPEPEPAVVVAPPPPEPPAPLLPPAGIFEERTPVRRRLWVPAAAALVGLGVGLLLALPANRQQEPDARPVAAFPPLPPPALPLPAVVPALDPAAFAGDGIQVSDQEGALLVSFVDPVFLAGTYIPDPMRARLLEVAAKLRAPAEVRDCVIVGHTGADPMPAGSPYPDNYALGLARAQAVFNVLVNEGQLPRELLAITTAGGDHPPVPHAAPQAVRLNRTVTLRLR